MADGRKIILIGGYSGVGKNTFASALQGRSDTQWMVLSNEFGLHHLPQAVSYFETSFATSLKRTVSERLWIHLDKFEDLKDIPLDQGQQDRQRPHWHGVAAQVPTLRDVLIDEAAYRRSINPNHYAAATHAIITKEAPPGAVVLITDWRYPNEHAFYCNTYGPENVFTVRVVRDEYRRSTSDSEHALDLFIPDFLAVPHASGPVAYYNKTRYGFSGF
jgi:hypothetical protein